MSAGEKLAFMDCAPWRGTALVAAATFIAPLIALSPAGQSVADTIRQNRPAPAVSAPAPLAKRIHDSLSGNYVDRETEAVSPHHHRVVADAPAPAVAAPNTSQAKPPVSRDLKRRAAQADAEEATVKRAAAKPAPATLPAARPALPLAAAQPAVAHRPATPRSHGKGPVKPVKAAASKTHGNKHTVKKGAPGKSAATSARAADRAAQKAAERTQREIAKRDAQAERAARAERERQAALFRNNHAAPATKGPSASKTHAHGKTHTKGKTHGQGKSHAKGRR